jgi:CRISPR-associated protein Cmr4
MATYKRQCYLLMTTDPVHIGTGGYRLGRVDNSIVREPGTRIPKIPGTSLHGAARSYAARLYETLKAAGQSQDKVENPDQNPVCYTFGYIKRTGNNDEVKAYSGVVNIFDAHVLLFPVHSMAGPVWVSTLGRLTEAGFNVDKEEPAQGKALLTWQRSDPLNLGWLMVDIAGKVTVTAPDKWKDTEQWKAVCDHLVLVQESLFSQVVNSNLEVRTSVSINPKTGAAEEGALFTYEAIPRATFLTLEVVLDDYRDGDPEYRGIFPSEENLEKRKQKIEQELNDNNLKPEKRKRLNEELKAINQELQHIKRLNIEAPKKWKSPLNVVENGLRMIEWLGVGGMGTRGFGRLAIVGKPIEEELSSSSNKGNQQSESEEVSP